ncbi:MAG: feruloyl-CoA synthase [Hyphomicrobiales bacterium]|nr:feruloyl-CoA synthase [Hyphomicrobiales bacterium]
MSEEAKASGSVRFGDLSVDIERRKDGCVVVRPRGQLPGFPLRLGDRLHHWAAATPDAVLFAERDAHGDWRKVSYGEALDAVRHLASALLALKLTRERPLLILSGNSINHALLGLAANYIGVPHCPVSPPYSLLSRDHAKLKYAVELLTPGLVYAEDGAMFARAIEAGVPAGTPVAVTMGAVPGRATLSFADLLATPLSPGLDAAFSSSGPETIVKFLLTSGSTGLPKVVINTQKMLCANQVMIRETMRFLQDQPPVLVDWLPWSHTFGGNHNVGLALFNGGALYIDDGRPTPGGIAATLRNLREIAPTVYFNVPKGFEMLVPALREDEALRKSLFSRLGAIFFAGASLPAHVWKALQDISEAETGHRVPILTGLGATETAPFSMSVTPQTSRSGHVGQPVPGNEIKLVPNGSKWEVRVRGNNVTPGYWRQPEVSAAAFDDEGYYKFGDALKPVDDFDWSKGFDFDGRIAEDFKLASGTWVNTGPLRSQIIAACAPLLRDVVLAGLNRDHLAALLLLDEDACRSAIPGLTSHDLAEICRHPGLRRHLRAGLQRHAQAWPGSSTQVPLAIIIDTPLQIDLGEITDKGSVNQRAVLQHRAGLVEALYATKLPAAVISLDQPDE